MWAKSCGSDVVRAGPQLESRESARRITGHYGIAAPQKRKTPAYCGIQGGISHVYHPCTHGAMYKSSCTSRGSHVGEVNGEGITVGDGLLSQYVNRVIRRFHTAGQGSLIRARAGCILYCTYMQRQPRRELAGHVLDLPLCRRILAARLRVPVCFSSSLSFSLRRVLELDTRSFGRSQCRQRNLQIDLHLLVCWALALSTKMVSASQCHSKP
jgi:hypothetical protein